MLRWFDSITAYNINPKTEEKMYYILQASPKAFVIEQPNKELIITPDPTRATRYAVIGEAMQAAVRVNQALGTHTFKVESVG